MKNSFFAKNIFKSERKGGKNNKLRSTSESEVERLVLQAMIQWDGITPLTYAEAMASKDAENWKIAIKEEISNLENHETFEVVDREKLPTGYTPIGCKWVFKVKLNPNRTVERYKARLVAQGFTQKYGIDYEETYAPVMQMTSFRWMMSLGVLESLEIDMMDITGAYLNGTLKETIFMKVPVGMDISPNKALKLKKSLYGLKQAGRVWYDKISTHLKENMEFVSTTGDKCIFIRRVGKLICLVALYVDDLLIIGKLDDINKTKKEISKVFDARDLGTASYCLGVQIAKFNNGEILIYQEKYIMELLERFKMSKCNPVNTPMMKRSMTLEKDHLGPRQESENKLGDQYPYMNLIGALMYLSVSTRPDISFAVNLLSRYNNDPCERHWSACKRILRYLQHTKDLGIYYCKDRMSNNMLRLRIMTDAAESDLVNSKHQTGVLGFVENNLYYFQSTKQDRPQKAITDAEQVAGMDGMYEALSARDFLDDLGLDYEKPVRLLTDSATVIDRVINGRKTRENKHLLKRFNVMSFENNVEKSIKLEHVAGVENTSDMMTKPLEFVSFVYHRRNLNMKFLRVLQGKMSENDIDKIKFKSLINPSG